MTLCECFTYLLIYLTRAAALAAKGRIAAATYRIRLGEMFGHGGTGCIHPAPRPSIDRGRAHLFLFNAARPADDVNCAGRPHRSVNVSGNLNRIDG